MAAVDGVPKARVFFKNTEYESVDFELEELEAQVIGGILYGIASLDVMATVFLLIITYVTTPMDGMKDCEKLLVYNVLLPDLALEILLLVFYCPAAYNSSWRQTVDDTKYLAFLHTFCAFHPHMATAAVCHIISMAMTDAYRFEMSNDTKHMMVVILSTVSITICFCSLPVTEDEGYVVLRTWLGSSFNINYQWGSLFMCLGLLVVVCYTEAISVYRLFEARKFYQEHRSRVTARALQELDQDLLFCVVSLITACCVFPTMIGITDPVIMFVPRALLYMGPLIRVLSILVTCPHFQFAFFGESAVENFAVLSEMDEIAPETGLNPLAILESAPQGLSFQTEV